jgi:hypothetical protein
VPASKTKTRRTENDKLTGRARSFFRGLTTTERGKQLLREQNHCIEFDLPGAEVFQVRIHEGAVSVLKGRAQLDRFDLPGLIHLELSKKTLELILLGELGFIDALIPSDPAGTHAIKLLECTLFKWSVLNWLGRLFREAQAVSKG